MSVQAGVRSGVEAKRLVTDGIRSAILSGEMSPGQRLVEAELTELFDVTRGSARAALEDLAAEGLLERIPNRGARVRRVSLEEAVSILECRGALEGLIAARAADRITPKEAARLTEIGEAMTRAVDAGEVMEYSRLNQALHALVEEVADQDVASGLIQRLRSQIVRHQFQLSLRPGRPQVSLAQHLAIIQAVTAHQPRAAERAARLHVDSVISALLNGDDGARSRPRRRAG